MRRPPFAATKVSMPYLAGSRQGVRAQFCLGCGEIATRYGDSRAFCQADKRNPRQNRSTCPKTIMRSRSRVTAW